MLHGNEIVCFRTIEVKEAMDVHHGVRVNIRGGTVTASVRKWGAHASKPEIEDVLLMKDKNMNSVRLSHYPADP